MSSRRAAALGLSTLLFAAACTGPTAAPPAEIAPKPRVFVEAMVFDLPEDGPTDNAVALAAGGRFDELLAHGTRRVSVPHVLVASDENVHMTGTDDLVYALDVFPHVEAPDRVRLDVALELGAKKSRATLVMSDKQLVVVSSDVVENGRRLLVAVRPQIVKDDAALDAMLAERRAKAPPAPN